ncbi:hypothetical protein OUZ56_016252 [Daphnia magna]|uniref:Uncharacterized protein n=1 Tax=Daphnia magna TaxID=35525 RepID=A0ABR0AQ36_9CRUS|nr:hypothetical protein OUZ56_016252 [Daphnia magna]
MAVAKPVFYYSAYTEGAVGTILQGHFQLNLDCYPEERLLQPPMNLQKRVPKRYLPVPSPSPSPSPSPTRRPSTPLSPPVTPTSSIETDETRYNVQRILDEKFYYNHANQRIHEYFVKFRQYPSTENCCVYAEDLYGTPIHRDFEKRKKKRKN